MDREIYLPVRFDQPPCLLPGDAAQATDNDEYRADRGSVHARISRARPRIDASQREREPRRAGPEYSRGIGHDPHKSLQISVSLSVGDDALVIFQSSADELMVSEILDAQRADRRERMGEQTRDMGLPNGGMGIIRHLGLVDGYAVDALDATNRGTPGGRKGRREDDTISTRTPQGRGELCSNVPSQGGVEFLVHDAGPASDVRGIQNALRREACGHGAGVGIEGYGIQVICEHLCCTEIHSGPVSGVDELDTGIRGAGKIVGDYSYQQISTLRLRLRLSAFQHFRLRDPR